MPYIFSLWLKDVPDFAILFCRLLLIKNLIEQLFTTLSVTISAVGNIRKFQLYSSILHLLPLAFSYLLFVLGYPAYFLYVVFLIYSILSGALTLYFAKTLCGLSISEYFGNVIVRSISSFLLIFAISSFPLIILDPGLIRTGIVIIVSLLSYSIIIWFIGFSQYERIPLQNLFKSFLRKLPYLRN